MGLAGIKFSGSMNKNGPPKLNIIKITNHKINVTKSLITKNFLKVTLSEFIDKPKGLEDPVSWSKKMWATTIEIKIKGIKKWKEKKRIRVGSLTLNPPHNHSTIN